MCEYIDIRWHWEDVKMCADDNEIEITDNQAREILKGLKDSHDATLGINWDVILCEIEGYITANLIKEVADECIKNHLESKK